MFCVKMGIFEPQNLYLYIITTVGIINTLLAVFNALNFANSEQICYILFKGWRIDTKCQFLLFLLNLAKASGVGFYNVVN